MISGDILHFENVITGKTVRLRAIDEGDAEATFSLRSDSTRNRFIHGASGTVEDQRSYIQRQMTLEGDWLFVIEDHSGEVIGMKGLYNLSPDSTRIESGRLVSQGTQIQNIETLLLSFDFAFNELKVGEILMDALERNHNVLGIQKKFGAEQIGRERSEEFGCDSIHSVLSRESYERCRPRIVALVDRFSDR